MAAIAACGESQPAEGAQAVDGGADAARGGSSTGSGGSGGQASGGLDAGGESGRTAAGASGSSGDSGAAAGGTTAGGGSGAACPDQPLPPFDPGGGNPVACDAVESVCGYSTGQCCTCNQFVGCLGEGTFWWCSGAPNPAACPQTPPENQSACALPNPPDGPWCTYCTETALWSYQCFDGRWAGYISSSCA